MKEEGREKGRDRGKKEGKKRGEWERGNEESIRYTQRVKHSSKLAKFLQ